ncbi:MAG: radical SAM protein [Thermodesulfovibrionales bacterium]
MPCTETTWLSNKEYLREFTKKTAQLRIPLSGTLDLTHRCNLRCVHCYLGHSRNMLQKEMDTKQILSLIDEFTEAGCLYFLISGGEPLLRSDFPDIYRHAKNNGLIVTVFTNGTLITNTVLELFHDLPPYAIEISLYGATSSTYEKISCVPGSYEQSLNGIKQLLYNKIRVRLKTILMTLNSHEFFDIKSMADKFGVKFRFDAAIFPCLNSDKAPLNLRVSPEEAIEKEFSDEENVVQWIKYFEKSQGSILSDNLYHCGAGVDNFYIDPYGNLKPCLMTTNITYNIANGGFLKGWHDVSHIRDKKAEENIHDCTQCEKIHLCGFCPAFFELETGSENIRSEYLCAMGEQRFQYMTNLLQGVKNAA